MLEDVEVIKRNLKDDNMMVKKANHLITIKNDELLNSGIILIQN